MSILSDAYRRRADLLNRGFGGYNSRTLTPIVRHACAAARSTGTRFALATLFLGANDACSEPLQNVPADEYKDRLEAMIAQIAHVADAIVVVGTGPVDIRRWPNRSNAAAAAYNDAAEAATASAIRHLTKAGYPCKVLFVSLYAALTGTREAIAEASAAPLSVTSMPQLAWLDALSDGLHLSSSGNSALAALVLDHVRRGAPAASPEGMPEDWPHWSQIPVGAEDQAEAAFTEEAVAARRGGQ